MHRFTVLDSWRGIAACIIALFHFRINSHLQDSAFLEQAGVFVDFFFVLSGFVIFANYAERLQSGFGFCRFMFLRLGRLYPLHIFILSVHIGWEILQILFPLLSGFAKFEPFGQPGESLDFIVANLFLVHSLGFYDYGVVSFNGASWSISTELYAYAVFAALLIFSGKYIKYTIAFVCCAAAAFLYFNHIGINTTLKFGFIRCLYGFGIGALLWYVYSAFYHHVEKIKSSKLFWSFVEIVLCSATIMFMSHYRGLYLMGIVPLFAIIIFVFSFERGVLSDFLKNRFFVMLGVLSYSIYMTHSFIGGKVASAVQLFDRYTAYDLIADNEAEDLGHSVWQGDLITLFYLIIVVSASFGTYKLIEKPARNFSRKLVKD